MHLLDYLARDYGGAVAPGGKVRSESEYREQVEFAAAAERAAREAGMPAPLVNGLAALSGRIAAKGEPEDVSREARRLQGEAIRASGISLEPASPPDSARGRQLYLRQCASCHGESGRGDGPAGAALEPKPANFLERPALTPFQAFNTIRLGVPGTAMAAFKTLSDQEAWELAYAVVALRGGGADNTFAVARTLLEESVGRALKGDRKGAREAAIRAYLEGVEPAEPKLRALDAGEVVRLETAMSDFRAAVDALPPEPGRRHDDRVLRQRLASAREALDEAERILGSAKGSAKLTFLMAAAIVVREGFEAALMLIALLGVTRAAGTSGAGAATARQAARWIHVGWIGALVAGAAMWGFSGWLMAFGGASRELTEGVTSLLAVAVLLYMGFWLHSRTEIGRWKEFIDGRVRTVLEGRKLAGLAAISFIAVFREAFETVLFLRALWLEGGASEKAAMLGGALAAIGGTVGVSWAILRFSARIPIRQLFSVSSALMAVLAWILTGKGLHSLQEGGQLGVTPIAWAPRFDWLGIYPSAQTLLPQLAVLGLVTVLWLRGSRSGSSTT